MGRISALYLSKEILTADDLKTFSAYQFLVLKYSEEEVLWHTKTFFLLFRSFKKQTNKMIQFNLPTNSDFSFSTSGEERKKQGISRISKSANAEKLNKLMDFFIEARLWEAHAPDSAIGNGVKVYEFTSDDIRELAERRGGFEDIKPNSWGALLNRYALKDKIEQTGEWIKSRRKSSHSRKIPVWQIIDN